MNCGVSLPVEGLRREVLAPLAGWVKNKQRVETSRKQAVVWEDTEVRGELARSLHWRWRRNFWHILQTFGGLVIGGIEVDFFQVNTKYKASRY